MAWVLLTNPDGTSQRFVRTVGTMTADLLALGDGLRFQGGTQVALERTGVRWRPVFNGLEAGRPRSLVKAQHRKAGPGRKPAVKASAWLAELVRHGLRRPSLVPPPPIRVRRDLTR